MCISRRSLLENIEVVSFTFHLNVGLMWRGVYIFFDAFIKLYDGSREQVIIAITHVQISTNYDSVALRHKPVVLGTVVTFRVYISNTG